MLAVTAAGTPPSALNWAALGYGSRGTGNVLGVDVESDMNYPVATAQAYGSRLTDYIHGTLHATSIGIVWVFCDPSFSSDECRQPASAPCPCPP